MNIKDKEYVILNPLINIGNNYEYGINTPYFSREMKIRALEGSLFTVKNKSRDDKEYWFDIFDIKYRRTYTVVKEFIQQAPQHLIVAARLKGEI